MQMPAGKSRAAPLALVALLEEKYGTGPTSMNEATESAAGDGMTELRKRLRLAKNKL